MYGQLGRAKDEDKIGDEPDDMGSTTSLPEVKVECSSEVECGPVVQVALGHDHTCAVLSNGAARLPPSPRILCI